MFWACRRMIEQRARVLSAGGHHAGTWLAAFPISLWTTARGRHYSLALNMRLGQPLPELLSNLGTPNVVERAIAAKSLLPNYRENRFATLPL